MKLIYGILFSVIAALFIIPPGIVYSSVTGPCSGCHTMHNSQDSNVMVTYTYGSETTDSKEYLLIGTCLGCHAEGSSNIVNIGGNSVPQVYHPAGAGDDLAGGNFAYILGTKGGGASDNKGHNVSDFGDVDNMLDIPPGQHIDESGIGTDLTCAGAKGCHGKRGPETGMVAMKGAHHNNSCGQCDNPTDTNDSYRFLKFVAGLENNGSYKWQNKDYSNHNEYLGQTSPVTFSACSQCHHGSDGIYPENNDTISGFCGTCHGNFHLLSGIGDDGIGGNTDSPFKRHPTDVLLPGSGEYSDYNGGTNQYSVLAPVARTTVPASIGTTVSPGSDVVMCLSCHAAHATDNPDMLRWNYRSSSLSTALSGCNVCHTSKN